MLLQTFAMCFVYSPSVTFAALESLGLTVYFLQMWFSNLVLF